VHVLQGERPLARDNRTLGRFHLVGIPPAPRGVPQIEVTFDVDSNGIVSVSAKDLATQKEQKITVTASSGLSKDDVERLVKEAQSHAAEDQNRRELVDARNEADALAYSVTKTLNDLQTRVPAADRSRVEAAIADLRKVMETDDLPAIKRGLDDLRRASQGLAQAQNTGQGQRGQSSNVADGEVIDAEPVETHDGM
jgi:molecular chaperone DnaK